MRRLARRISRRIPACLVALRISFVFHTRIFGETPPFHSRSSRDSLRDQDIHKQEMRSDPVALFVRRSFVRQNEIFLPRSRCVRSTVRFAFTIKTRNRHPLRLSMLEFEYADFFPPFVDPIWNVIIAVFSVFSRYGPVYSLRCITSRTKRLLNQNVSDATRERRRRGKNAARYLSLR